jgi:hypothetical protein
MSRPTPPRHRLLLPAATYLLAPSRTLPPSRTRCRMGSRMRREGAPETAAPHPSDSIPALACQAGACASRPASGLRLPVAPPARADSLAARAITTSSNADRLPGKNAVCFSYPLRGLWVTSISRKACRISASKATECISAPVRIFRNSDVVEEVAAGRSYM